MPTAFPAALDSFTNPTAASSMNGVGVVHSDAHSKLNDAVAALQAKVGTAGSADPTSLEYRVSAGGGGSVLPIPTTFTTAVKFDAYRDMGSFTPTGPTAFTIDTTGSAVGGETTVSIVPAGGYAVTFTGMSQIGAQGYDQGYRNEVSMFRTSGGYYYGIALGAAVVPAPVFSAQSAPAGTVGSAYSYTYAASNTSSFAVFSGTLPAGLSLNTATGALTGTPTTAATSAFVIRATGPGALTTNSTSQSVTIAAASAISFSDAFTDTAGTLLTAHTTVDSNAATVTWAAAPGNVGAPIISPSGSLKSARVINDTLALHYASWVPSVANYTVSCDIVFGGLVYEETGILARASTSVQTRIECVIDNNSTTANAAYSVFDVVAGAKTLLFSRAGAAHTPGTTMRLSLELVGTGVSLFVQRPSDNFYLAPTTAFQATKIACGTGTTAVTAAGRAGVAVRDTAAAGTPSSIKNFAASA